MTFIIAATILGVGAALLVIWGLARRFKSGDDAGMDWHDHHRDRELMEKRLREMGDGR
jgi:hypothetical protein